ncbi:50S ribosomal protein L24 [soil metagenome]
MLARLRKGDEVIVISGKDKGKKGKVSRIFAEDGKVVVEGINLVKRHLRPNAKNPQGGILEKEAPIYASKVMPIDPKTGKGTRIKIGKDEKGKKIRLAAKSGEAIAAPAKA